MSSLQRGTVTPPTPFPIDAYATSVTTTLNVTAQTVIKASPGRLVRIDVTVAGTTAGSVNDTTTIAGIATSNLVASIPAVVGPLWLDWPCLAGIVVTPGASQTSTVAYY
jgi:hypothetical protein